MVLILVFDGVTVKTTNYIYVKVKSREGNCAHATSGTRPRRLGTRLSYVRISFLQPSPGAKYT